MASGQQGLFQPLFSNRIDAGRLPLQVVRALRSNEMAAITASMVGALRAKTDAPMMECKKALAEADGDMERAEELLRVKLGSKASKAASRIAAEGVVAISVEGTTGAIVEVNCETDFVTKNDSFLALAKALAGLVGTKNPADVTALSALPLSQDGFGPTVEDVRKGLIGKIGENMSIRRFQRYAGGGKLASYLHGTRIGVLLEYEGDEVAAKDVAMHVAAMKPVSLAHGDVPPSLVDRERRVAAQKAAEDAQKAKAEGKAVQSPEIVARRVEGSVAKYLKEVSLHNQSFVKNDKQTVEQMLKEKTTRIKAFTLYVVGEGIEKKTGDFAAEVAAQVAAAKKDEEGKGN
jgi:elongation factor Ts